jgi:NTP pyrophosphatase (non-canonical NTP hydrolase)
MTEQQQKEINQRIISHFGAENQRLKILEEAGEFQTALARCMQYTESYKTKKERFDNLKEETADIMNMINQLFILQGEEFEQEVRTIQGEKLMRTNKIIDQRQNPF